MLVITVSTIVTVSVIFFTVCRLTTDDILRIRRKLGLTQREAGELIGGGPNAFSRYENGRSYPTKGVENFLRILDKHPEQIDELRRENAVA